MGSNSSAARRHRRDAEGRSAARERAASWLDRAPAEDALWIWRRRRRQRPVRRSVRGRRAAAAILSVGAHARARASSRRSASGGAGRAGRRARGRRMWPASAIARRCGGEAQLSTGCVRRRAAAWPRSARRGRRARAPHEVRGGGGGFGPRRRRRSQLDGRAASALYAVRRPECASPSLAPRRCARAWRRAEACASARWQSCSALLGRRPATLFGVYGRALRRVHGARGAGRGGVSRGAEALGAARAEASC